MKTLGEMNGSELIKVFNRESEYIYDRTIKRIYPAFIKKYAKYATLNTIEIERIKTHDKNEFIIIYELTKDCKSDLKMNWRKYGVRYVNDKLQVYLKDIAGITSKFIRKNPLEDSNGLTLINQHLFERYNERCNLKLSLDDSILSLLKPLSIMNTKINEYTLEINTPIKDGMMLGSLLEDGTLLYRTFVNKLFLNQKMDAYYLNNNQNGLQEELEQSVARELFYKDVKRGIIKL